MAESKVSLKLLINSQTKKVLFAEANKDCVDFLFHILSLPTASVIRLLRERQGMVGSLQNLYESLENLNETYIQPNQNKDALLKPMTTDVASSEVPLLLLENATNQKLFYRCGYCNSYAYSDDSRAVCTACKRNMSSVMTYVAPPPVPKASSESGIVKGVVTYMVMDDLVVKPMSTISSLTLLNKFNVKEVGILQEKVVDVSMDEVSHVCQYVCI
ncbi:hypothetical protein ACJIZ3_017305 [Penstemon smallii]|uniref:DUF674 domain-containing protein n=1 Tax=Penstemon smallii TaxID=265156 RepID=A0ABD3SVK6_9LAMI